MYEIVVRSTVYYITISDRNSELRRIVTSRGGILTTFALLSRKSPENMAFITSHRAVRIALWAGTLPSSSSNITSAKRPGDRRTACLSIRSVRDNRSVAFRAVNDDRGPPCSRQMSSNRCLTTCLYRLLRSLLTNCSRVCILPSTMSNCGSSRNSAACLISCGQERSRNHAAVSTTRDSPSNVE